MLAVEGAWIGTPGEAWSGGFVARLKDGRRAHEAGLLDGGEQHPELGARHGWQGHAWDDAMARRLNELLDRVDP